MRDVIRNKGYTIKALAERWGVSIRRIQQLNAAPTQRHIDAINGLPRREK